MADYTTRYRITAVPQLRTVTPGAQVTYYCARTDKGVIEAADAPRDTGQWFCYNDRSAAKARGKSLIVKGPAGLMWKDAAWGFPGKHTIKCCVKFTDGTLCYFDYPQWVTETDFMLAQAIYESRKHKLPDALVAMSAAERYVQLLKRIEKKHPIKDRDAKKEHDELVQGYTAYCEKLADRLTSTGGCPRYPIHAVHLEKTTQRQSRLNIFVSWVGRQGNKQVWKLVDWTNPVDRTRTTEATGTGATTEEAIRNAFKDWDERNRYPDGWIKWEIPARVCGKAFAGSFTTDGSSFWDSVASFFEWVAIGAAVLAAIVALIAPVPGSSIISVAIWASIFTSTAAAAINIGQRHEEGFGNWKEDAFDCLTIAGNLFAGAGAWAKGGMVIAKNAQGKALKYALVGQVGTDAVQGVLIAVDHIEKYDKIMSDASLTPDERARKLMELFRSLAVAGVMTLVSVKASKADLDNLNKKALYLKGAEEAKTPKQKLDELKDPAKTLDTTKVPQAEGHTKQRKQKTKVQEDPQRAHPEGRPKKKTKFDAPPQASKRGMLKKQDASFALAAQEEQVIILARDSNEAATNFIGKPGYAPKPVDVKTKTLKSGPNAGLAAANPSDPKLKQMLAEWPDPQTGKKGISYDDYVKQMDQQGYKIGKPPDYLVGNKATGEKYYSDIDLHGVYKEGGADAYSEAFRGRMNGDLGGEMIQHGPHDKWPDRLSDKAGPNKGPQPPVTAYLPDGSKAHLKTAAQMKAFYKEHGIDWDGIWQGKY